VASYELLIKSPAAKELERLPRKDRERIARRIGNLASDPRPAGNEKLSGQERYRVRQGNYRVIYEIDDPAKQVTIVKIAHRREAYS
jgi:mRNA interferase RelE/StbE